MKIFNLIKENVMERSRSKKEDHFYSLFGEGMNVLDVGVSDELGAKQFRLRNRFLKKFRYSPKHYTGLGVGNLSGMENLYPGKRFIRYDGKKFPFSDCEFDWVYSNAVIEHVGREESQLNFLNEMMRVGKKVFFTTPNKYFPVESHTNVLFLHWFDDYFYSWCRKNWQSITKENLYLLNFSMLRKLLDKSDATNFQIHKNRTCMIPMTFTVTCTAQRASYER